ncbi:NupC/NupG family nucleoside CNT transporter [Desertivirga xinjiangensis]|uniref:NupC/NupG family nucleoside CNT transporter n=1 Tax=Desertivirga xinjiangensis TaxID=539206 RepID=UPI002108FCE1|nr:nucleoside transporter C-terminal domain-containing protein [Pedobacter xinjiangensis]
MDIIHISRGLLGALFIIGLAFLLSSAKKSISWKIVISGLIIQLVFAIGVLKIPLIKSFFAAVSGIFVGVLDFTKAGATFLFGDLITRTDSFGYIFAFQVLPTIIFFSALTSLLYYLNILQKIVFVFAWIVSKFMRLSGAESLAAAGNIFLGQTEAPLLVKPYIEKMTRSEILCLMIGGMATIAGGVLAAYVGFLGGTTPEGQQVFATHLLCASVMSAPAAILISKILLPETEPEKINSSLQLSKEKVGSNVLEAISIGTSDGLRLAVNVGAMLLVFTALMAMINYLFLQGIGSWTGLNDIIKSSSAGKYEGLTLQYILGYIFSPVAWLIGVDTASMTQVGQLLGEKTILNEFYAYGTLANLKTSGALTDQRAIIIATYALCGFSNFASIGIQIGGIGALAPNQRENLSKLGIKALIGGTLACLLTAAIVGMII